MTARRTSTLGLRFFLPSLGLVLLSQAVAADDPLAPWREARISEVAPQDGRHTIHSYYTTTPESPDGGKVILFASSSPDGHVGDVVIRDRASGKETVIVSNLKVEDAHRVACQQWVSNGKRVVFHGQRNEEWFVGCVDLDTMKERVLATGQLAGWGQPDADVVPLYGMHWNPGEHRGLDLIHVATGEKHTVLTVDALKAAYPEWYAQSFGDGAPSIFFPVMSPDMKRVFFKMAMAAGGDARSKQASARQGLICYSLEEKRFLFMNAQWGHPGWHPDKKSIVEVGWTLYDSDNGARRRVPGLPPVRGDHPSVSPDGKLMVTDSTMDRFGGSALDWGIVLSDARGNNHIMLHKFSNARGARSWRKSHPHPAFSPDGKRIYFNVSSGPWTSLHVAEVAGDGKG
jgi:hypothetical protein